MVVASDGDAKNEMWDTSQGLLPRRCSRRWKGDDLRNPKTHRQRHSFVLRQDVVSQRHQASKYRYDQIKFLAPEMILLTSDFLI